MVVVKAKIKCNGACNPSKIRYKIKSTQLSCNRLCPWHVQIILPLVEIPEVCRQVPPKQGMMTLAAKTDSPLPLLFGWAVNRRDSPGLQLASQIQWGALRGALLQSILPSRHVCGDRHNTGKVVFAAVPLCTTRVSFPWTAESLEDSLHAIH